MSENESNVAILFSRKMYGKESMSYFQNKLMFGHFIEIDRCLLHFSFVEIIASASMESAAAAQDVGSC